MRTTAAIVSLLILCSAPAALAGVNLIDNPGLEKLTEDGKPLAWEPLIIGAPAQFTTDEQTFHGGARSIRIDAGEIARSYLRSAGIPVAAGEVVEISAWVKTRDVPAGQGTVILIAEFARGTARGSVAKVDTAKTAPDWQQITGRVTVPTACDTLRVRMGFSYSKGTAWWDDVQVRAAENLVAQIDAAENRVYPARQNIPLAIINRDARKQRVQITATTYGHKFTDAFQLTGDPVQRIELPARIPQRGKLPLTLHIAEPDNGKTIWTSKPDNIVIPQPLTLLPPSPTHWVVEDGAPRIRVEFEAALDRQTKPNESVAVKILNEASEPVFTTALPLKSSSGLVAFDLTPPRLPEGRYRLVTSIDTDSSSPVIAEQPWAIIHRVAASTRLNNDGYLEKNGKPIFPLGMFNNEARLKEEVEAGFNIVHFYNAARVFAGMRPDDQRLADAMNRCHEAGAHVLLMIPQGFSEHGDWDAFIRRIRMFRNHPALLAWDEEEGLARGDMKIETLQRVRQILREEDPHHPLMVGDAKDVIGRITDRTDMFPVQEMDLGMWWWYPLPLRATAGDELQGEQASGGLLLDPPTFLTESKAGKPLWIGLQAYKKPGPTGRYPTPVEYRAQAYLAIIHGARGLMWYGGSVTGGAFQNVNEASWDSLKQLVSELRGLAPVLMGRTLSAPEVTPKEAPISVAIKESGSRRVLLAVNRGPTACDVTISLPEPVPGRIRLIGEDREATIQAGRLSDRFDPYSTHVYELQSGN